MSQASSSSVVQDLLSSMDESELGTEKEQEQGTQQEEPEEQKPAEQKKDSETVEAPAQVITKEMVKEFGLPTWMLNAPISDLGMFLIL